MQAIISHVYDSSKKTAKHSHLVSQIKSKFDYYYYLSAASLEDLISFNSYIIFICNSIVHPSYHDLHNKNDKDNNNNPDSSSNKTLSQWYLFNDFHITPCST